MVLECEVRISSDLVIDLDSKMPLSLLEKDLPAVLMIRDKVLEERADLLAMARALAIPLLVVHEVRPGEFSEENIIGMVAHIERPVKAPKVVEALKILLPERVFNEIMTMPLERFVAA